ncbi:MAG: hypothetical protein ACRDGL_00320, partial [Candidatus Limnocylindrales bacterium]
MLPLALAGLVAAALMGAAVGVSRSAPSSAGPAGVLASAEPTGVLSSATAVVPTGAAAVVSGPSFGPLSPSGDGPVDYGLAEPAGALPGSTSPEDVAAWSQIRADLAGSGACWLRSDLDEWLTRAITAFPWLGSPAPCS